MKNSIFPVVVKANRDGGDFTALVPDLPGCHANGATVGDAITNIHCAIETHLDDLTDQGLPGPVGKSFDEYRLMPEYADGIWGFVEIAERERMHRPIRVNISLPENLVHEIDAYTKAHHLTRSGFLAKAARRIIEAEP